MLGDGRVVTSGGRVMAVSATADTLKWAVKLAYAGVSRVKFHGKFYGHDVAHKSVRPSLDAENAYTYYRALPHRLEAPTLQKLELNSTLDEEKE